MNKGNKVPMSTSHGVLSSPRSRVSLFKARLDNVRSIKAAFGRRNTELAKDFWDEGRGLVP